MQIKITTDYTIRTLLCLYGQRGRVVTTEEISRSVRIPFNYVHKVTRRLKSAGYIKAVHGQFGGYQIREPADGISLYDVIRLSEPEKINRCLEEDHECSREAYGECAVARFYELAQEEWDQMLKCMTLKALAEDPDRAALWKLLGRGSGRREEPRGGIPDQAGAADTPQEQGIRETG